MRAPNPSQLLEAWEQVQAQTAVARPAVLLSALAAELTPEASKRLPLGARDAQLLAWRERTFGSQLNCLTDCPHCRALVEFSVATDALSFPVADSNATLSISHDGWILSVRLPNSSDLEAALCERDQAAARSRLFARCLLSATHPDGEDVDADAVPDRLVCAAGERMAQADPLADFTFDLRCPECATAWKAPFDAAGFFSLELQTWSKRLLCEVHELASAYGWSESEIFALSSDRRHAYLELVRA